MFSATADNLDQKTTSHNRTDLQKKIHEANPYWQPKEYPKTNIDIPDVRITTVERGYGIGSTNNNIKPKPVAFEAKPQSPSAHLKENLNMAARSQKAVDELPKATVTALSFYPMSRDEIKKSTVCKIINTQGFVGQAGTPFDYKLGPFNRNEICVTCGRDYFNCALHEGYIELKRRFINPLFKKEVLMIRKCICSYCGRLYVDDDILKIFNLDKLSGWARLKAVAELSEKIHFTHANCTDFKETFPKDLKNNYLITFTATSADGKKTEEFKIPNDKLYKFFDQLTDEEVKRLGMQGKTHPRNMILHNIVVCSHQLRPTINIDGKINVNYLTTCLNKIIEINNKIKDNDDYSSESLTLESSLYNAIVAYISSADKNAAKGGSDKSLMERLGSKKGLVRENMMGKRNNFCARTVAGPAAGAHFGEILVPRIFTKYLTVDETVTRYNIERLQALYYTDKVVYLKKRTNPHARINNGENTRNKYPVLQLGDVVVRRIQDGDSILCGRQPTLHAESFMAFTVKLHDQFTNALHSSVNKPFNADFDGDELNIFVIQGTKARNEAIYIANVKYHLLNNQSSGVMMGLAYNSIMSAFMQTMTWSDQSRGGSNKDVFYEVEIPEERWDQLMQILPDTERKLTLLDRAQKHGITKKLGRLVFSMVLPVDLWYSGKGIIIRDGIIVHGFLNAGSIGAKRGSLVQVIAELYSIQEACRFINDGQLICDWFIQWHGLSISMKSITGYLSKAKPIVDSSAYESQLNIFKLGSRPTDETKLFFWNRNVLNHLSNTDAQGKIVSKTVLPLNDPLNIMGATLSGAKGSYANISQIVCSLGMQLVQGTLPPLTFNEGTRSGVHFFPDDASLRSYAYIPHSFAEGITPAELFFHARAGREGSVSTNISTAEVGYFHRRLDKTMENHYFSYNGLVETPNGVIFNYASDFFNIGSVSPVSTPEDGSYFSFINLNDVVNQLNGQFESQYLDDNVIF